MRGGKRPGAGRRKGSRNKASAAREMAVAASGLTPLAYMLAVMRDELQPLSVRMEMAKAAAPYVHPRFSAIEHRGEKDAQLRHKIIVKIVDSDGKPHSPKGLQGRLGAGTSSISTCQTISPFATRM